MSGVHRFLSRREKKLQHHTKAEKQPDHFGGIFAAYNDSNKKQDKEEERKVKGVLERLQQYGVDTMVESNVEYALRAPASKGDGEAAFRLLMLLQETYEGLVRPFNPNTKLLGAVNRESVTCFLDALLFAMFARLDSFEAMLYDSFDDIPRRKLAGLLRLWVNMLRTGRLITTDITAHLQQALSECGWTEATRHQQQDPSEAFTFITGQLELPLLTLKMDLYHTGKEDLQDDHKFVNERLLEVALVDRPSEEGRIITLEDCLEHYFNNRIEVKRHMESRRRNTMQSSNSEKSAGENGRSIEKESGLHVEVAEVTDVPITPPTHSPATEAPIEPAQSKDPFERLRPGLGRKRADSIFSQRKVELTGLDPEQLKSAEANGTMDAKGRKMSMRTEVLMPAWQFFKLLPWYTDHQPTSDAQVASHFARKRPVLGICLKRYAYTATGQATRRNDYIDIPLEIGVPNFVSDDNMHEEGPLVGNFKLLLQSVVCHRGVSTDSGHYISLCRGTAANAHNRHSKSQETSSPDGEDVEDPWMRFDDLAKERISYVDIHKALREETPYLLFYQVQPIGDDGESIHDLPTYAEATSRSHSETLATMEKPYIHEPSDTDTVLTSSTSNLQTVDTRESQLKSEAIDLANGSTRTSFDVPNGGREGRRGRSSGSFARRRSITFDERSFLGSTSGGSARTDAAVSDSVPTTPSEERSGGFLSVASKLGTRRGSKGAKGTATPRSRPTSTAREVDGVPNGNGSRFSLNMAKLTQRRSRGDAPPSEAGAEEVLKEQPPQVQPLPKSHSDPVEGHPASAPTPLSPEKNASKESVAKSRPSSSWKKAGSKQEKRRNRGFHGQDGDRDCVVM